MAINSRLARLIDLVPYISQHQGIPISQLADKFAISKDELEKDLWLLYCCGLPGQTPLELMEFSFEDGYVTVRNADELKRPRSLTQTELATLIVGLDLLSNLGSKPAEELRMKLSAKFSGQIAYKPDQNERYVPEILSAIQSNNVLRIKYNSKVREVIPFELYSENGSRYVRAYCKSVKDRRTFKLSRIEALDILEGKELPPNSVGSEDTKFETKIRIHRQARLVREALGIPIGVNTSEPITIQYFSKNWLLDLALSFGGAIELLEDRLRSEMRERILASQNLYLG